ncbi:lipoprotein [Vibrio neptunius]|uniref:lipoprotein n=1 Tax=Vibrio neptunius TaxID=170651 RepID=UPI003314B0FD
MKKTLIILLALLALAGCSKPLPEEKLSYVGEWQSAEMYLLILADGTVAYERLKSGGTTSINASIKEFVGDDFVVGFSFLTTTFVVSKPPQLIEGQWLMEVDGVTLVKTDETSSG